MGALLILTQAADDDRILCRHDLPVAPQAIERHAAMRAFSLAGERSDPQHCTPLHRQPIQGNATFVAHPRLGELPLGASLAWAVCRPTAPIALRSPPAAGPPGLAAGCHATRQLPAGHARLGPLVGRWLASPGLLAD